MGRHPGVDIFCRVIDNLGDAGVCWRLSRQLADMGHPVRLWIDDLHALARIAPAINPSQRTQAVGMVTVLPWPDAPTDAQPQPIVIEAFACALPDWFIERLHGQDSVWINLEYLSAESWVESCHGLPSPQAGGRRKYFFFPGFTSRTGGLLREADLISQHEIRLREDRRSRLGGLLGQPFEGLHEDTRVVFLFCYPDAPLEGLMQGLAADPRPALVLAPGDLAARLSPGGGVQVRTIDYIAQERFDALLGCCDLNFVRGEDSLVRAIWAAHPLVWHIYKQPEQAHRAKLDAWLDRAALPFEAQALMHAWNRGDSALTAAALTAALAPGPWRAWQRRSQAWAGELADQADLATQLLSFCEQHRQTR